MGIFDRAQRHAIYSRVQHPYKHSLSDFGYINPALPGVSNVESALNYIMAVLYPNTQENVPTPGDLPTGVDTPNPGDVTPTIGDYRVVDDDGDGKSAGYRWEQREGEAVASWHKIFDVDWSTDAILAAVTDVTNDLYMYSKGKSDLDGNGDVILGLYAGQKIFGGNLANQNLTLNANSGDGVGAQTGFVQIDSNFRPTLDDTFDLSTATERWKDAYFSGTLLIDTLSISTGSITDSTGNISFGDENLSTTGNITGAVLTGSSLVADDTSDSMTLAPGSITDTTGAISFGAVALSTSGTLGAGVSTFTDATHTITIDPNTGATEASIIVSRPNLSFGTTNLVTTGTITAGDLSTGLLDVDNLRLDGNTLSSTDTDGNINITPDGSGNVIMPKLLQAQAGITATGTVVVNGLIDVDNIMLDGNTISTTDVNGNLIISPNGTGNIVVDNVLRPLADNAVDLGQAALRFQDLFMSGSISDGTDSITSGTLLALRSVVFRDLAQTQPAQAGDSLFYDAVNNIFLASTPDSEIDHTTISNLTSGDAGHTQFVMLDGRASGQVIRGGTGATENLVLESTSNASKGRVLVRDELAPETNASYSGGWSGVDLGDPTLYFKDLYTKGQLFGARLENVTSGTLPAASVQNIGRVVFATDTNKAYVDVGTEFKVLGVSKFIADTVWDGVATVVNTDVSASITDARNAQWQLLDNANDFEVMAVKLTITSASNVRITVNTPLPVGSYRLIGIE